MCSECEYYFSVLFVCTHPQGEYSVFTSQDWNVFLSLYQNLLNAGFEWIQVYVVPLEDYSVNKVMILRDIFSFLGLHDVSVEEMQEQFKLDSAANRQKHYTPMYDKTNVLVRKFYMDHNLKMANLMQDSKYSYS